jgi:4-alpha-glucanotransferase
VTVQLLTRSSGLLLHPTALPGPFGRGDLGPAAYRFVRALQEGGQALWQILPLGPPGWGGSPYGAGSAFAGDAALISPEVLVEDGWLAASDLDRSFPEGRVSAEAGAWRGGLLAKAHACFEATASAEQRAELVRYKDAQASWLVDYSFFAALKAAHGGGAFWRCWPEELVHRDPETMNGVLDRPELATAVRLEVFCQFQFDLQWGRLRTYARERGVQIMGDVPIFVARDSADVWAQPELFELDASGEPTVVAGVPPDDFCEDGQLWGNPLYRIEEHVRTGYAWWVRRFKRALEQVDVIRVDHFRGFASWWEVPASAETAREGQWVPSLGLPLFEEIAQRLGVESPSALPVVAEDLGLITPDVEELLAQTGFPGMKILQFAFYDDDSEHPFKPENHPEACVVYTGTHDNETTAGWFEGLDSVAQERVRARIGEETPAWGLAKLALSSPAILAVLPVQDLLDLGNEARFNSPGVAEGNWSWRLTPEQLGPQVLARLRALTEDAGRLP